MVLRRGVNITKFSGSTKGKVFPVSSSDAGGVVIVVDGEGKESMICQ